ncbi:MAG: PfkB family carbohydrate kinase [Candidatus Nezhaarchaeota archaeon]|nr:PfkB family carbohydrate kinase [Candidatus Nezhaarchaeota archaeon]
MDIAVAGHVTYDLIYHGQLARGRFLGGTATYSSLLFAKLFFRPLLVSRVGQDLEDRDLNLLATSTKLSVKRSEGPTTRFEIRYLDGKRRLRLLARCDPLAEDDIEQLGEVDLLLLGPVAGEIEPRLIKEVIVRAGGFVAAVLQGFLRRFNASGEVSLKPSLEALNSLSRLSMLCGSSEEVMVLARTGDLKKALKKLVDLGPSYVAATMGRRGSWLALKGFLLRAPCYPVLKVVDPTGAGDVYAGVLALLLSRGEDATWSMSMATAAASFTVESLGPIYKASLSEVEERAAFIAERITFLPL